MLVEKRFDRFILGNIEVECFVGIDPEVDCEGKGVGMVEWRRKKMKFSLTLTP